MYNCYMDKTKFKKYNKFEEFNEDSYNLTEYIRNNTNNFTIAEKIDYARNVYNKLILNSYIVMGKVPNEIKLLLHCDVCEVKFSMDNMIKNRLTHPEISDDDYIKIPSIIKNPSKYYKSKSGYDVILFKECEKYYKLVIKTTRNKKEIFIKSLHLLNVDRYRKY